MMDSAGKAGPFMENSDGKSRCKDDIPLMANSDGKPLADHTLLANSDEKLQDDIVLMASSDGKPGHKDNLPLMANSDGKPGHKDDLPLMANSDGKPGHKDDLPLMANSDGKPGHKDDLPLMANSDDILVRHYILHWSFNLKKREVEGSVVAILDPVVKEKERISSNDTHHFGVTCVDSPNSPCSNPIINLHSNSTVVSEEAEACHMTTPSGLEKGNKDCESIAGSSVESMDNDCYRLTSICDTCPSNDKVLSIHPSIDNTKTSSEHVEPAAGTVQLKTGPLVMLRIDGIDDMNRSSCHSSYQREESLGQHKDLVCNKMGTCSCGLNRQTSQGGNFNFILDCCDLCVNSVEEVIIPTTAGSVIFSDSEQDPDVLYDEYLKCRDYSGRHLDFSVEKWCLRIWDEGVLDASRFPRAVRIKYKTSASGASLSWTKDQDRNECVFTPADCINNRSLFPCQEPPMSLASWQAHVTVPPGLVVLMSGDNEPVVTCDELGLSTFYYHTKMPHPAAVLAIAVGHWKSRTLVEGNSFSGGNR
jgi:hypothetical protein